MITSGYTYVYLGGYPTTQSAGVSSLTKPGYLEYTKNIPSLPPTTATVWVKDPNYVAPVPVGAPGSGDLYGTGEVTTQVAMFIAQVVIGGGMDLTPAQFAAVDMDGDGVITMADVLMIMQKATGF